MTAPNAAGAGTFRSLGLMEVGVILGPRPNPDALIAGLAVDSREVAPGFLFAALKGGSLDGAEFVPYAVRMGACGVLCALEGALRAAQDLGGFPVPFFIHPEPRAALAHAAAAFSGAQPEVVAAVTGTNGKTSVASFLRQIWDALGLDAASFGTTGVEGPGIDESLPHTTPEPIRLHALLARLAGAGVSHAAMEASSHGLAQHRLDGVRLRAGALTNITRDHLDYHLSFESYASAKLRLFSELLPCGATAVLNADDPIFPTAAAIAGARGLPVLPVGLSAAAAAGLRILGVEYHAGGQSLRIAHRGAARQVDLALIGGFQGANALTAAALAIGCGADADAALAALPGLCGVRGRMQLAARRRNGAAIYVDYAHTPDALKTALGAVRLHTPGRVHVVFGAGGDRDRGKRPLMGAAAAGADVAIVTDDNPRSENPATIRAAVMAGAPGAVDGGDRAEAILRGVGGLAPGDCLLIAGKGHESRQIIGAATIPFDDAEQARASVAALDGEAARS